MRRKIEALSTTLRSNKWGRWSGENMKETQSHTEIDNSNNFEHDIKITRMNVESGENVEQFGEPQRRLLREEMGVQVYIKQKDKKYNWKEHKSTNIGTILGTMTQEGTQELELWALSKQF